YSTFGAAGELFAFRGACFREIPATAITDDFFLSLSINLQGYTIAYAPEAVATEAASLSLRDEWNRKVRIAAGGFQSLAWFRSALHPFRHPRLALQFFSHRVLRWVACAPALVLLFTSNLVLFLYTDSWFYSWAFGAQSVFYGAALAGFLLARTSRPVPFFFQLPFYFVLMHAALPVGWWRFVRGKQSAIWQKAQRSVAL
ncbi:MAG TPA: glycosyltransferase family 2 protein, partial [Lacibacter sp.]|nr:glycosyltransferase family 2 protein [Lacibacter sp.]